MPAGSDRADDDPLADGILRVQAPTELLDDANRFVTDTVWGTGQTPRPTFGQDVGVGTPRTFQLAVRYDF